MEYQPLAPKKGINRGVVIGAAVGAIVAVIVIAILLVAFNAVPVIETNKYPIFKGDYAVWDYTAMVLSVPVNGTIRLDIINVTSTTFTVTMSAGGDVPIQSETKTYPIEESVTTFWTLGTFKGMEYVYTPYGTKYLKHYVEENASESGNITTNYYVGKDNNWPYNMIITESGISVPFAIIDTNIEWVKNG
jgi:hypothetical protein